MKIKKPVQDQEHKEKYGAKRKLRSNRSIKNTNLAPPWGIQFLIKSSFLPIFFYHLNALSLGVPPDTDKLAPIRIHIYFLSGYVYQNSNRVQIMIW